MVKLSTISDMSMYGIIPAIDHSRSPLWGQTRSFLPKPLPGNAIDLHDRIEQQVGILEAQLEDEIT